MDTKMEKQLWYREWIYRVKQTSILDLNKYNLKKISVIFVFIIACCSVAVFADERCPDYCLDGTLYTGKTYSLRTASCSDPTDRSKCEYGCDGDACASRPEPSATSLPPVFPTRSPTIAPPSTTSSTPPTTQITTAPRTVEILEERKFITCNSYCSLGVLYYGSMPTADGRCTEHKTRNCSRGCSATNAKACDVVFTVGPAYFTDPFDDKVKPIPEAFVSLVWTYEKEGTMVNEKLPSRKTNLDGAIDISKDELYKHLEDSTASLAIRIDMRDFANRFEIRDAAQGNTIPFLEKTIFVSNQKTHTIDFNFDRTEDDRRNAKVYYHNWEAVNFSEKVLGTKIDLLLPETIVMNKPNSKYASHSSTNDPFVSPLDWGISYPAPTTLNNKNSPENMEWHEFCHHIMMDEFGYMVPWVEPCGCDEGCNHCGITNFTSSDAWIEGWAEFCSLAIKDYYKYPNPQVYSAFGSLEVNHSVITNEELAVASTLWDIYDSKQGGDGIQISIKDIWNVLRKKYMFAGEKALRHIHNFREIYLAFNQSGLPGILEDSDNSGTNNINTLYVDRGCYLKGEYWSKPVFTSDNVGLTLWFNPKDITKPPSIVRPNRPLKSGASIGVQFADKNNRDIPLSKALIKVTFQNNSCGMGESCDYEYTVPVEDGKIYLEPPGKNFDATIEVTIPLEGKDIKLTSISAKEYWNKYNPNNATVENYFLKIDDIKNVKQGTIFLNKVLSQTTKDAMIIKSTQLTSKSYKITGYKNVKLLWLIPAKMKVDMEIDSYTGATISFKKPWWSVW